MARRQYAFVVSEEAPGKLAWLALSSAMSVRICDGDADIVLVADAATRSRWPPALARQLEAVFSHVLAPAVSPPPGPVASRHLKTSLRQLLAGDLLFLDVDTLMFDVPLALFAGDHDVGAVPDRNWQQWRPHRPEWVGPHYRELGWSFSTRGYFNSGVLFLRDSAAARELGAGWHRRWTEFFAATAKHQDQPSFNSLLDAPGLKVRSFPLRYNAMVDAIPYFCWRAKIVHYFLHGARRLSAADSLLAHLADTWQQQGEFDRGLYLAHRSRRDPWIHPTQSIQIELAAGNVGAAALLALHRALGR
jgi:hypothetical protein